MEHRLAVIFISYLLDLIFGDPSWSWHPTRIIGRLIKTLEKILNTNNMNGAIRVKPRGSSGKRLAGIVLVLLVVGITVICVWVSLKLAMAIHAVFYFCFSVLFIYFVISIKDLGLEAGKVQKALLNKDIPGARRNLSMIAGRDTEKLSEPEVVRATVETISESTMDGIIAPLFYAFLGGPVLAWAYKAINTLDSMVGYRNQRFIDFGKASAKLDALANLIPAKITSILIFIAGWGYRKERLSSSRWITRYFLKGAQYNSEAAEAAMAGVLGIQLGGLNFYDSVPIQKKLIGDNLFPLEIKHIKESIKIAYISSVLFMGICIFLIWITGRR